MIRAYFTAGFAALIVVLGALIYRRGGADQRADDAFEEADEYRTTRKVIDYALSDDLSDDDVLDSLRRHAKK